METVVFCMTHHGKCVNLVLKNRNIAFVIIFMFSFDWIVISKDIRKLRMEQRSPVKTWGKTDMYHTIVCVIMV